MHSFDTQLSACSATALRKGLPLPALIVPKPAQRRRAVQERMADDDVRLTLLADFRLAQTTTDPQSAVAGGDIAFPYF